MRKLKKTIKDSQPKKDYRDKNKTVSTVFISIIVVMLLLSHFLTFATPNAYQESQPDSVHTVNATHIFDTRETSEQHAFTQRLDTEFIDGRDYTVTSHFYIVDSTSQTIDDTMFTKNKNTEKPAILGDYPMKNVVTFEADSNQVAINTDITITPESIVDEDGNMFDPETQRLFVQHNVEIQEETKQ